MRSPESSHRVSTAMAAAVGVSIAWSIVGFAGAIPEALVPGAASAAAPVAAGLFALAAGVRAPHRLSRRVGVSIWRRVIRGASPDSHPSISEPSVKPAIVWMTRASSALIGGVSIALSPLLIALAGRADALLQAHFVWSDVPLSVVHFGLSLAVCGVPLACAGFVVAALHFPLDPRARLDAGPVAWVVVGAGLGCAVSTLFASAAVPSRIGLLAASIPLFVIALASSALAARHPLPSNDVAASPGEPPSLADCSPRLLRASVVAVGGGAACAMVAWSGQLALAGNEPVTPIAAMLFALAAGLMVEGSSIRGDGDRSIGGFGGWCCAAGVVVGIGAILADRTDVEAVSMLPALAGVAAIGACVSFGCRALLDRVAAPVDVGSLALARLLTCAAVTVWITAPLAVRLFGHGGAIMMLAVSLVALGGVLIVHESRYGTAPRRARLGMACAIIVALILSARHRSLPRDPSVAKTSTTDSTSRSYDR